MLDLRAITDKRKGPGGWHVGLGGQAVVGVVPYKGERTVVAESDTATAAAIVAMDHTYEALLAVAEAARIVCDPMVQDGGGDRWWSAHDDLARALAALDAVEEPR